MPFEMDDDLKALGPMGYIIGALGHAETVTGNPPALSTKEIGLIVEFLTSQGVTFPGASGWFQGTGSAQCRPSTTSMTDRVIAARQAGFAVARRFIEESRRTGRERKVQ